MPHQLTSEDARQSLTAHVAARGLDIREKYGPSVGWAELQRILADRECVRYPCELAYDAGPLEPGECAYPEPLGERPEDGFRLCVHPYFATDPDRVVKLALYQAVAINYGAFASPEDAESFGSAILGIDRESYYHALCEMADEISYDADEGVPEEAHSCSCGGHGGDCGNKYSSPSNPCTSKAKG
jgi:hypothetical protein